MAIPTVPFEALAQPDWSELEHANARTMADFVQLLMNEHDFDAVRQRFSTGTYVQHNRGIPDGIDGLTAYVERLVRRYPEYSYDVRRIVSSGDLVVFHSHATLRAAHRGQHDKGFVIFDMWRVIDGKINNHWDALQPLDLGARLITLVAGGQVENSNGLY